MRQFYKTGLVTGCGRLYGDLNAVIPSCGLECNLILSLSQ